MTEEENGEYDRGDWIRVFQFLISLTRFLLGLAFTDLKEWKIEREYEKGPRIKGRNYTEDEPERIFFRVDYATYGLGKEKHK